VGLSVGVVLASAERGVPFQDLGLAGAVIETGEEPRTGDHADVVLRHPLVEEEIRLPAVVSWVTPTGLGVEFVRLDERSRRAVAALARTFW
jgi:hypothetical protein